MVVKDASSMYWDVGLETLDLCTIVRYRTLRYLTLSRYLGTQLSRDVVLEIDSWQTSGPGVCSIVTYNRHPSDAIWEYTHAWISWLKMRVRQSWHVSARTTLVRLQIY